MSTKRPFYLKQWRQHRHLSQQALADRLDTTKGYISELERQIRPYNQALLEAMAHALMCEPVDLLIRDPMQEDSLWTIYDQIPASERSTAIRILKSFIPEDDEGKKRA